MPEEIIKLINEQLSLQLSPDLLEEELQNKLSAVIEHLIEKDFKKLVYILYKVDVSEVRLRQMLKDNVQNASFIIAKLIMERQLQKLKSRKSFIQKNDIPEDEKW